MSAGVPPASRSDSATVPDTAWSTAGRSVPGEQLIDAIQLTLRQVVDADPALHWLACVQGANVTAWPADTVIPRGVRELAARAELTGRVTCTLLPASPDDAAVELVAVPDTLAAADESVVPSSVLVIATERLPELVRAGLIRRLRGARTAVHGLACDALAPSISPPVSACSARTDAGSDGAGASLADVVLDAVATHGDVGAVALATAEACARRFDAQRVTLGVERHERIELLALSGETRADKRRAINRLMLAFMRDVLTSGGRVSLPASDGAAATSAANALMAANGGLSLLAFVQTAPGGARVLIVIERSSDASKRTDGVDAIEAAIVPVLGLLGQLEIAGQGRLERSVSTCRRALRDLRSGRPSRRLLGLGMIALLVGLWLFCPLAYRISGRVSVEASDRQVLVAPFAGHLLSANTRAGDVVTEGQVLATLDDRELRLARDKWLSEASKNKTEQAQALAVRDRVELARLRADEQRLEAEVALVDERRDRAAVRAPFDGVILSGDPTRSLGAPVSAGDVLFEIARGDRQTVLVEIDERDIALVDAGAAAEVRMAALPRQVFAMVLDEHIPVAVADAGRSVFRMPATLQEADQSILSPGMQGVARIDAGTRSMASAWTRPLRQRLLLLAWKAGLIR